MYILVNKDEKGIDNQIGKYSTKQEANYYKKNYPKSKVISEYEVFDLNKGLLSDNYITYAENPMQALQKYIADNQLNISVKVNLSNRGRFVVRGNHTSKVYEAVS